MPTPTPTNHQLSVANSWLAIVSDVAGAVVDTFAYIERECLAGRTPQEHVVRDPLVSRNAWVVKYQPGVGIRVTLQSADDLEHFADLLTPPSIGSFDVSTTYETGDNSLLITFQLPQPLAAD